MLSVKGIYQVGEIMLDEHVDIDSRVPVIVTFLEDVSKKKSKKLDFNSFSFNHSCEALNHYKGSLSDTVPFLPREPQVRGPEIGDMVPGREDRRRG